MTGPRIGVAPRNGLGTTALVGAIVGLAACWSVLGGVVFGVAAIVLGVLGRGRAARQEANNGEIATAGIALGFLAVIASLVFAVIWSYAWRDVGGGEYLDCVVRAGNDQRFVDACTDGWLEKFQEQFSGATSTREST